MNKNTLATIAILLLTTLSATAQCTLTESRRKFEGAERTIIRMENPRVIVEVVPELEGRVITYADKSKPKSGFEWLDDCPYHYGGRWEGVPFQYRVDAKGPDRAAVTVSGGGKIAVALLHQLTGADVASPLDLKVERTMSIDPNSTKLNVEVKITNVGDGVAPTFRYMVHAVFGQVPPMPGGRAFLFLPTARAVEFFGETRGNKEMWICSSRAPLDHPFSRFTPGIRADKPRYEAGGWGALLTSAGPVYIQYDAKEYDFMQYWFGGDSEWHYTFEPHTKPVDLKPGETLTKQFSLAYDSRDVAFAGPTVSYEQPDVPEVVLPGGTLTIKARATTVRDHNEEAKLEFEVNDPKGQSLVKQAVTGEVQPFSLTELSSQVKLPTEAGLGAYAWRMRGPDGKELATGRFEIVTADEQAKRVTQKATAALQAQLDALRRESSTRSDESRRVDELWREGVNLALTWNDDRAWPDAVPRGPVSLDIEPASIPVLGQWKAHESARIKSLAPIPAPHWPADAAKLLASLGADQSQVRDLAATADGKGLVALIVDTARNRVQVATVTAAGVKRFGDFSDKPAETDGKLGGGTRALAVDPDGNLWVATNAWGKISVLGISQDGSPFEQAVIGAKGALKKFAPDGKFLGGIGLLAPPSDLALATADSEPVVLASYRQVSKYHTTQVREGTLLVRSADVERMAEVKMPGGGSLAIDKSGQLWSADVAGHVACFNVRGHKLFDVNGTAAPAVPDAVLPAGSPLPVILRAGEGDGVRALSTLKRTLSTIAAPEAGAGTEVPATLGAIWRLAGDSNTPVVVGEKGVWAGR